ncbi:hypothetical protein ACHAWF_008235 [Thalassiosira exigua]
MVEHAKRRKHHDKDKYYRLAKEQGYRSRAAFKLAQINRKFDVLRNARTVVDLCAAPGGWTQVVSRSLPQDHSATILAVDVLPIRSMRNVMCLVGDITTEKCKAAIRSELQGAGADVVLHDGAPNVGSSYDKDAYVQNEIALHALKCACEHLKRGGTFVTKLYRSRDYSAYLWCAKRFFEKCQAVKPAASRSQSAEIFLVCQGYLAPDKVDPRMFDPRCVFEQVDGQGSGGGDKSQTGEKAAGMNVFHKDFGKRVRSRSGYDTEGLDASMRKIGSVRDFLEGGSDHDPIRMLSDCTGLAFFCDECKDRPRREGDGAAKASEDDGEDEGNDEAKGPSCGCSRYLAHRLTTSEVKACLSDLKVLNKSDFKGLLTWREKVRAERRAAAEVSDDEDRGEGEDDNDDDDGKIDSDDDDERVQSEIEALRLKKQRERKRKKKKERDAAARRRRRAALGMDLNAIDVPQGDDAMFSLATINDAGGLEAAREVDLGKVAEGGSDSAEEDGGSEDGDSDSEDEGGLNLERELDAAYEQYLSHTKDGMAKSGTRMAKRTKKLRKNRASEEAREDAEAAEGGTEGVSGDARAYAELLRGAEGGSDESGGESDDCDSDRDGDVVRDGSDRIQKARAGAKGKGTNAGGSKEKSKKSSKGTDIQTSREAPEEPSNPLIFKLADDPPSVKTSRWFSNPLFESIESTARSASFAADRAAAADEAEEEEEDDAVHDIHSDSDEEGRAKRRKKGQSRRTKGGGNVDEDEEPVDAEDVVASMPKTDKQRRREKRLKSIERMERRNARRGREAGTGEGGFGVAPGGGDADEDVGTEGNEKKKMSEAERRKRAEARALIKAGMGDVSQKGGAKDDSGFEVVKGGGPLPVYDERKYDSENEDYDSDDYAKTLALGTMILRKSKEKAMVDASYNRYAWNDPQGLPDWFVDDENRHYRPQLPIPPALLEKMKARYLHLATKPIAKVAEARARKSKMARGKLAAAKKKAEAVANSSEMSEATKLKAISRAMRGKEASRPGKTYVVARKGGGSKGGKGIKLVDKREKNDKRATERIGKRKKQGKKGGMTGSKRRRHHK